MTVLRELPEFSGPRGQHFFPPPTHRITGIAMFSPRRSAEQAIDGDVLSCLSLPD